MCVGAARLGIQDGLFYSESHRYPDYLTGYLLVFWVFVTNVLFLNMLIAMMNKTLDNEMDAIESKILLDVSHRILLYERAFPELVEWIDRLDQGRSVFYFQYWKSLAEDVVLVLSLNSIPLSGLAGLPVLR